MSNPNPVAYRFGSFTLDPASRVLSRFGEPITLAPKSLDCIAYLLEHQDRAVGRDELISAVWGRADVNDALLSQTLLRARRAINDTGERQARIRTVPRFGYQWVGEFEPVWAASNPSATSPHASASETEAPSGAPLRTPFPVRPLVFSLLVVMSLALLFWMFWPRQTRPDPLPDGSASRLAVLPVDVEPETPDTAWIRLGAMDFIASRLQGQSSLTVIPSNRVLSLQSETSGIVNPEDLRDVTHTDFVVVPTAIREASGWRFNLALQAGTQTWEFESSAEAPLLAAAAATDQLLQSLGFTTDTLSEPTELTERLQQIDAELLTGQLSNARELITATANDPTEHPELLIRLGQVEFRAGRIEASREIFEQLLEPDAKVDDAVRSLAMMGLGAVALRDRKFDTAEQLYEQALSILLEASHPATMLGNAFNGRGISRIELGRVEEGIADLGLARIALQQAADEVEAAAITANIGLLEMRMHRPARATREFAQAITTFERFEVIDGLTVMLAHKSQAELALLNGSAALDASRRAVDLGESLENPRLLENAAKAHIDALLFNGQLEEAGRWIETIDGVPAEQSLRLHLEQGDLEQVRETLEAQRDTERTVSPELAFLAVQAALAMESTELAHAWRDTLAGIQAREDTGELSLLLADALIAAADGLPANQQFAAAMEAAVRNPVPADQARAGAAWVIHLVDTGQLEQASMVFGQISPYAVQDYRVARAARALYESLGDASLATAAASNVATLAGERDPEAGLVY